MGEKLTRTQIKNLERFGGVNPADQSFSRRQFAAQVGGYALAAGGAVAGGLMLPRSLGHGGGSSRRRLKVRSKDYSVGSWRSASPAWLSSVPVPFARGPSFQGGRA